jgi:hypothetical protein
MGRFTKDAEEILEGKGVAPERPLVLQLLGRIVNEVYDNFADDNDKSRTIADRQRIALDKTFKSLNVTHIDEWRRDLERDGYVKMFSPLLGECFYLCKDDNAFNFVNKGGDSVDIIDKELIAYSADELKHLKTLTKEDVKWIHLGKKFKGQLIS